MITVTPPVSVRLFWGAAALSLYLTACAGLGLFPAGLLLACPGIPLGILASLAALGFPQTRFDEEGITRRSLFLTAKRLKWEQVALATYGRYSRRSTDDTGWERVRDYLSLEITGEGQTFRWHTPSTKPEKWWPEVQALLRAKLPADRIR
jgi:hypothetical protein